MPESTVRASLDMGKESRVVCPAADPPLRNLLGQFSPAAEGGQILATHLVQAR